MLKECIFADHTGLESCTPLVPLWSGNYQHREKTCCLAIAKRLPSLLLTAVVVKHMKIPNFEDLTDAKSHMDQDPRVNTIIEELRDRGVVISENDDHYPEDSDKLLEYLDFDIKSLYNQSPK